MSNLEAIRLLKIALVGDVISPKTPLLIIVVPLEVKVWALIIFPDNSLNSILFELSSLNFANVFTFKLFKEASPLMLILLKLASPNDEK